MNKPHIEPRDTFRPFLAQVWIETRSPKRIDRCIFVLGENQSVSTHVIGERRAEWRKPKILNFDFLESLNSTFYENY